jgi:hypothetical protein
MQKIDSFGGLWDDGDAGQRRGAGALATAQGGGPRASFRRCLVACPGSLSGLDLVLKQLTPPNAYVNRCRPLALRHVLAPSLERDRRW